MRDRNNRGRREPQDKHLINDKVTAPEVRLVGVEGEQIGIVKLEDALQRADDAGVDLVQVADNAEPPVCRLLDYGKLKYKESKRQAEARKHSATNTVKELRVRYSTDSHDLETKIRKARKFLEGGDRVKFQMRFRGREVVYKNLGDEIFDSLAEQLDDIAEVENRTRLMGNTMSIHFAPK